MKTHLGFGLYDVLIKGKLNKRPDTLFMSELVDYAKQNNKVLFLITGLDKEKGQELIRLNGIDAYFPENKIYHIDDKYYDTLSPIDKELKEDAKSKDSNYCDEYYKVYFFNNLYAGPKKETLFVGHDIWTDAYYLSKYSEIDVVLFKDTLTNNSAPNLSNIKDLQIIDSNFEIIKEYIETEKQFNYTALHTYAEKLIYKEMVGSSLFNSNLSVGKILDKSHSKVVLKKKENSD